MRSAGFWAVLVLALVGESCGGQSVLEPYNRGIVALHNFGYDAAADYFRAAEKIDPNFVLAYWGEALTFNHPFEAMQDMAGGRKALAKLGSTRSERAAKARTAREKEYLDAAEILYGDGDKDARDAGFANAMLKLASDYPDDADAAAFSALAVLQTLRYGDHSFEKQTKAAEIAKKVLQKYPEHPGALHYLIHAYDDPAHAHLALDAAHQYEKILDPNSHSLHMPSHIYVQLGLWPEVARANQAAFDFSDKYVRSKNLSLAKRDYHTLEWLAYAEMQMGQYQKAREHTDIVLQTALETHAPGMTGYAATVSSRFAVETSQWDALSGYPVVSHTPELIFAQGMAAAARGDKSTVTMEISALNKMSQDEAASGQPVHAAKFAAMSNELNAQLALSEKRFAEAGKFAADALEYEADYEFPSGPPDLLKPAHELYGEVLLASNKPKEAAEQFAISLQRMPKRALSLLGLARASSMLNDTAGANKAWKELAEVWANADPGVRTLLPGSKE
jgi:tetratricopeptide (TPR) repeat protein